MYAYKGFQRNLICRGYQFVMGLNKTDKANCRANGFHCAENPLDCLSYYSDMDNSEYYLVNAGGDVDEDGIDSKISCTELTILHRLTRQDFFLHALAYMVDHAKRDWNCRVQKEAGKQKTAMLLFAESIPQLVATWAIFLRLRRKNRIPEKSFKSACPRWMGSRSCRESGMTLILTKEGDADMKKSDLMNLRKLKATAHMMELAAEDIPRKKKIQYENGAYIRECSKFDLFMRSTVQNDILIVAMYTPQHMRLGNRMPAFQLYIDKNEESFLTYDYERKRWLTGKLDRIEWKKIIVSSAAGGFLRRTPKQCSIILVQIPEITGGF